MKIENKRFHIDPLFGKAVYTANNQVINPNPDNKNIIWRVKDFVFLYALSFLSCFIFSQLIIDGPHESKISKVFSKSLSSASKCSGFLGLTWLDIGFVCLPNLSNMSALSLLYLYVTNS